MRKLITAAVAASIVAATAVGVAMSPGSGSSPVLAVPAKSQDSIEHGRYLVKIASCNDCHTPGYNQSEGKLAESEWLTGSSIGFSGPWGTSYPPNLRLTVQRMSEDEWVTFARAKRLPPMPWFSVAPMSDGDLRDIYRFIRSLGPRGEPAPLALGPGMPSPTPSILFVPK